jgi:hypothetical protein
LVSNLNLWRSVSWHFFSWFSSRFISLNFNVGFCLPICFTSKYFDPWCVYQILNCRFQISKSSFLYNFLSFLCLSSIVGFRRSRNSWRSYSTWFISLNCWIIFNRYYVCIWKINVSWNACVSGRSTTTKLRLNLTLILCLNLRIKLV